MGCLSKFDLGKLKHQFKDLPFIDSELTDGSLYNGTLVGCGDSIYYLVASNESIYIGLNSMYCYDLENKTWSKRGMMEGAIQEYDCSISACEVDGKIWSVIPMFGRRSGRTTKLMCYDPTSDEWNSVNISYKNGKKFNSCTAKDARLVNYNSRIWIIGDYESVENCKVWSIDPNTSTIVNEKSIPVSLKNIKAEVSDDKIILIGTKNNENNNQRDKRLLYVYDGFDWYKGASLPKFKDGQECRFAIGATDKGIILTGMTDENGNDTYKYNASNDKWSSSKKG